MHLSVAIGMHQDAVLCTICSTQRFIHDVVVVPARHLRDGLGTDRADASWFFPEGHQPPFSLQGLFHLYAKAFFTIAFPCRVVGVTVPFALGVPFVHCCCGGQAKPGLDGWTIFVLCRTKEAPVSVSGPPTIAVRNPSFAFLGVPPPGPAPQGFEDGGYPLKAGHSMTSMT